MIRTRGAWTRGLTWGVAAMGLGLWLTTALSPPASAQDAGLENCRATLQECSNVLTDLQQQRDAAAASSAQCEAALKDANFKLELLKKSKGPGGLTHRDALALLDLSMNLLQEAATQSDISPVELLEATRKLKVYQTKATSLSLHLTQNATKASQGAADR